LILHLGEELSAYLDGELSGVEARKVTSHLAGCDECRDSLGELIDIRARLRSLPMMDYVWTPAERSRVATLRHRSRWVAGAAAAVAAVVVALATLSAPRDVISLNQGDFSASFVARQTLDENATGRLIPTDVLSGPLEGEGG
jgi:anti-sigma factor RsiW